MEGPGDGGTAVKTYALPPLDKMADAKALRMAKFLKRCEAATESPSITDFWIRGHD